MSVSKLRALLDHNHDLENNTHPTMEEVYHTKLTERDITHYLRTETDRRRLAYWCEQYLKLDY